ncbi:cation-translocating P-type ATPase [Streptomyces sp. Tue 6430]|nr:cation-translocating P-type ATPase [Streptomyces sp. Tue 6430]
MVAAAVGEVGDAVVITVVLQINAVLGYLQERRAERSLEALRRMLVPTARVRRDGVERMVAAESLVPGDVVLLETGDRVPADGRLTVARSVEVAEAALTGESQPVSKDVAAVDDGGAPVPLAERTSALFMNTALTCGRAETIVTATGMRTELGATAEALRTGTEPAGPLRSQLDSLGRRLAVLSGAAVLAYAVVALLGGGTPSDIALRSVALAVAAIPEGLPAVLALTLALGVYRMAHRGAVVKRLASVESLGSATVVCSDKTGTLTLDEMTARALWTAGVLYEVTGEGYGTTGTIRTAGTARTVTDGDLREAVLPFAACNDAHVTDGRFAGDPTETALVVLAAKAGVDADLLRTESPRVGEVPFDAANKYMATFHQVLAVHLPWARAVFGTVPLTAAQWALCLGVASTVLLKELALRGVRSLLLGPAAP